jgi:hypothetical protein
VCVCVCVWVGGVSVGWWVGGWAVVQCQFGRRPVEWVAGGGAEHHEPLQHLDLLLVEVCVFRDMLSRDQGWWRGVGVGSGGWVGGVSVRRWVVWGGGCNASVIGDRPCGSQVAGLSIINSCNI